MYKFFLLLFTTLSLNTHAQTSKELIQKLQGNWQEVSDSGVLRLRFWKVDNQTISDYRLNRKGKYLKNKFKFFFMNECPSDTININILKNDESINNPIYALFVTADTIAGIWCYWFDIEKDTLQIVNTKNARNKLRFIKSNQNIDSVVFNNFYNKKFSFNDASNPEKLFNCMYCCEDENGDENSGDGFRYRGRGLLQLTHKESYRKFTEWYNKNYPNDPQDFVNTPDLVNQPKYATLSALWEFSVDKNKNNRLFDNIENGNIDKVTRAINGNSRKETLDSRRKALENIQSKL